eukprot:186700-Prorocentrum_minimum.AAC.2
MVCGRQEAEAQHLPHLLAGVWRRHHEQHHVLQRVHGARGLQGSLHAGLAAPATLHAAPRRFTSTPALLRPAGPAFYMRMEILCPPCKFCARLAGRTNYVHFLLKGRTGRTQKGRRGREAAWGVAGAARPARREP